MEFFAHANQCHPDIVFTHSHGKSVAYLDVQASIQEDRIVTDLYEKPTNTHQYLLLSSNHPSHVHRNLPYGLGIRIRTIVSAQETLEVRLNELSTFLWQRGYSASLVNSQLDRVRAKSRDSILNSSQHSVHFEFSFALLTSHSAEDFTDPAKERTLEGHLQPASGFVQAAEKREGHPCPHQTRTQLQERKPGHPTWHPSVWLVITLQNLCNCEKPYGGHHRWQHVRDPWALQLPVGKCNLPHYLHCVYCGLHRWDSCSLRDRLNGHRHAIKEKRTHMLACTSKENTLSVCQCWPLPRMTPPSAA